MRLSLTFTATLLLTLPGRAADNWPSFRGPNGDGTAEVKSAPVRWSEKENVKWKTPIHGKGWSSPVIWGNQVWMTTADEVPSQKKVQPPKSADETASNAEQVTFFAVCVDRKTGKIVHDLKLAVEKDPAFCIDFNSYASCTPTIEDGRVYAHFGSHGTWCIESATGKIVWERRDLKCNHFRGPASSPILYKNLLILIFDGHDYQYVAALDKLTGLTVWKQDRDIKYATNNGDYKKAYATARVLEVDGKPQLICPSAENTIAYDPLTGQELWRLAHPKKSTMNVGSRPVAGQGMVYLTTGYPAQLVAIKQGVTGAVPKDAIVWDTDKGVPTRPSLLVVRDLLFMVSDGGVVTCLEAKSGNPVWSERLNGEFSASPVFAAGRIYLANQTGKTFVIDASRNYNVEAVNELDAGCMASPAILEDGLFLRTKTHLYHIIAK
jgi:outer membrane protein assembly factor BamB